MNYDDFCESIFYDCGHCWHLCTPGDLSGVIFREKEDYVFGMNLVALCAGITKGKIKLFTFQIMSNHFHFVLSGERDTVLDFYDELHVRLRKYLLIKGRVADLAGFNFNLIAITDLSYMRNVIAYVNRNGYLINSESTPFSYPWGANNYFFLTLPAQLERKPLSKISIRDRRKIFHTHHNDFPSNYYLTGEFVSPKCYTEIEIAENFFRSAHHYFNLISRKVEAFTKLANELGDKITYTDDELFTAANALSAKRFELSTKVLGKNQKIEIAKELHYGYNASNKQIKRVLRIDEAVVNELFPPKVSSR